MALFLSAFIKRDMDQKRIDNLFKHYEKAFEKLDLKTISGFYADSFISAGPKGTIAQNKKEFEEKAELAAEFYRSVGQNSARIISKKIIPVSDQYCMVVVHWGVTFEKTGIKPVEFDVSYIVQDTEAEPKIILFISHQDEQEAMQELGLQSQAVS